MPTFDVTTSDRPAMVCAGQSCRLTFTVTNLVSESLDVQFALRGVDGLDWVLIEGASLVAFPAAGVQRVTVQIAPPVHLTARAIAVRLDVFSTADPEGKTGESEEVRLAITEGQPPTRKPWWIIAAVIGGLLVLFGGLYAAGVFDEKKPTPVKPLECPTQPGVPVPPGCPTPTAPPPPPAAQPDVEVRGNRIILRDPLTFETNSPRLQRRSVELLREVAALIMNLGNRRVRIEVHTDNQGPAALNLAISERRAQMILRHLMELGVPRQRLQATGRGGEQPIASNNTAEGREKNRRVEFVLE